MQRLPLCNFCSAASTDHEVLMKCSGCFKVYYCSKEHQRFDWKKHKPTCRSYQLKCDNFLMGSYDSQLGASVKSDRSFGESTAPFGTDSLNNPLSEEDELPSHRPSVIRAAGRSKDECLSLTAIPERRKTLAMCDMMESWSKMDRRLSIDQQTALRRYLAAKRGQCHDGYTSTPHLPNFVAAETVDHSLNTPYNLANDARFHTDPAIVAAGPKHAAFVLRLRNIAQLAAASLRQYGWCALDNFLGGNHAAAILDEVRSLYLMPGKFADGQLVKTKEGSASSEIRSDKIYWFDNRVDQGVNIGFLVSMIDSVIFHLSGHIPPYKINGRSRAMLACYPAKGTKYVKHVDNPDKDGRCITAIYYLNKDWQRKDGGVLRLFPETSLTPVDMEPFFDRLLFFWSDRRNPHEVLPSFEMRYAITIWYFDAEERARAIAREQSERNSNVNPQFGAFQNTNGTHNLESHMTRVVLNEPSNFGSTDSVGTIMSSSGSIPSLVNASRYNSRASSLNGTAAMLDAAAAALADSDEYMVRRATLDLGHFSRARRSPDALRKSMDTVPETKSPDNEMA